MRKISVVIIIAAFIFLTACSKSDERQVEEFKDPIEISLWHYYLGNNKVHLETAIEEFNNTVGLEKGIIVTAYGKDSIAELEEIVTSASLGLIDSEEMPDIFSIYQDKAFEFGEKKLLCDLKQYFSEDELDRYVDSFLDDGILGNNELLMLPVAKSTEFLYINDTDFQEFCKASGCSADSLSTWEGIFDTAQKYYRYTDELTEEPNDGKAFLGIDSVANYIVVSSVQMGTDIVNAEKRRADLSDEALRRIFDNYYVGHAMGYYLREGRYRADDLRSGLILAYAGSSSGAGYFPTWLEKDGKHHEIDLAIKSYPVFSEGKNYAILQGAGMCVTKSNPEKEEAAATFLKWFTDTKTNIFFTRETGYIPVTKEAFTDDMLEYIETLSDSSDAMERNTTAACKEAMRRIMDGKTYSANPFVGSYQIRKILEKTLLNFADDGRKKVRMMKEEGKTEEEILNALDLDRQFDLWMQQVRSQLKHNNVVYEEKR